MKNIIYTQRVEFIESYGERRDCADIEIAKLLWECGYMPVPINNIPLRVREYLEEVRPDGILLTGGNDLSEYGGTAPERDETERALIAYGMEYEIPVYGFCRGMQIIADYFGAELTRVKNHVAVRHCLKGNGPWGGRTVNSFHNMAVKGGASALIPEAWTEDGVIEAIRVEGRKIYGTMWHPEREKTFAQEDIGFIRHWFG